MEWGGKGPQATWKPVARLGKNSSDSDDGGIAEEEDDPGVFVLGIG